LPKPLGHAATVVVHHRQNLDLRAPEAVSRADDGIRTRDPHLGKVMRYQLRYVRTAIDPYFPCRAPVEDSIRSPRSEPNRLNGSSAPEMIASSQQPMPERIDQRRKLLPGPIVEQQFIGHGPPLLVAGLRGDPGARLIHG
jgi:hypothetical protein